MSRELGDWNAISIRVRSQLSHIIRSHNAPAPGRWINIPTDLKAWHLNDPLPTPSNQIDNLILAVGDAQPSSGESATMHVTSLAALIGTAITKNHSEGALGWLLEQEDTQKYLEDRGDSGSGRLLRLKMPGWARYESLRKTRIESRNVLMAMEFGHPELDHVVENCFRPAVSRTGFELRTIAQKQRAGLIDDQLRVALRTSRFVVADLTHGNNGAYWESGFAEGLGRPVIYTCSKDRWQKEKTHFDTNHLKTIIWDESDLKSAEDNLTATIRATLPAEAKMED